MLVGLLVSYEDTRLITNDNANAAASPFVIAISDAGIEVLPSVMNVVILIAVLSVGNSSVFGSSRTLAALADQGQAPQILGYVDRKGRPLVAIGIASAFGFIAYASDSNDAGTVLAWMLALSGLSSIFTWGSICLAHIRFRSAWAYQGHSVDELAFVSQPGVIGSWIGFVFNCLILVAQFWTGAWPVDYEKLTGQEQVENFFLAYLAAPIVIISYFGYKWWYGTHILMAPEMDLKTGMRELNLPEMLRAEREEKKGWPTWKRGYHLIC
jgi:amino acid transporter